MTAGPGATPAAWPLPPRLAAVAAMLPRGEPVADIGTDHARLPVWLVVAGVAPRCVATDLREGPARLARAEVAAAGVADRVDVRVGPGLAPLRPGEVAAIAIAGMGGGKIAEILAGPPEPRGLGVSRLALQPHTDPGAVRRRLREHGWSIVAEDLVEDDGRLYVVIGAADVSAAGAAMLPETALSAPRTGDAATVVAAATAAGMPPELTELLWDAGPLLWRTRHPLLPAYAAQAADKLRRAAAGARAGRGGASAARADALLARAGQWDDLLRWPPPPHRRMEFGRRRSNSGRSGCGGVEE